MFSKEFFVAEKTIILHPGEEYITLQSLLKITGFIQTGGMVKFYLSENDVYVNEELENRRGRKLYPGDKIKIENKMFAITKNDC